MSTNNSQNSKFTNNADGFTLGGGTTERDLTVTSGNLTLTAGGSNTYTFPGSTDTLVGRASTDTLTNKDLTSSTNSFYHIAFRAYMGSTQSITTGADRLCNMDTTDYNIGSAFDTSASNYEFTAPVAGIYNFSSRVGAVGTGTSSRVYIMLYVNGSEQSRGVEEPNTAGFAPSSNVTADIKLAANDTVQVYFRTVTANITVGSTDDQNYFTGHYVCPAS